MKCPTQGLAIELGAGAGFAKSLISDLITTDIEPYPGVDQVLDATHLPYRDESLRFIGMLNVFHHISKVEAFFQEAQRCLLPGGRIFLIDQHPGWINYPILKYFHHEPFHPEATAWEFSSTGPLSGANGALAWMVFVRDRHLFQQRFPDLSILQYRPHSPLRYWLTGGLKNWSMLPEWAWPLATLADRSLLALSNQFGSFVDVELVKKLP